VKSLIQIDSQIINAMFRNFIEHSSAEVIQIASENNESNFKLK